MSNRWLVLLRAVNVSGTGKLPMAAFRTALAQAGFSDVATYIQTGNVWLTTPLDRDQTQAKVEAVMAQDFDLERPAMALSHAELDAALTQNPFPQAADNPARLHLMFLRGEIEFDEEGFAGLCDNGEEYALINGVFYLYTPNGAGRSKAANRYERFVKAEMITARNLNSCTKIAALGRQ